MKLERKCESYYTELEKLRPLVPKNEALAAENASLNKDIEELLIKVKELEEQIVAKDEILENALQQQSTQMAKNDIVLEESIDPENGEVKEVAVGEVVDCQTAKGSSNSILCARCKLSLDNLANTDDLKEELDKGSKKKRLQCTSYRILLRNLNGRRPIRNIFWAVSCMRAIIFAKIVHDSDNDYHGRSRVRLPSFVYTWFTPSEKTIRSAVSVDERDSLLSIADENRWTLYYSVKILAKDYVEAKIFFSLLDEKHGEDELVFALFCYNVLKIVGQSSIKWGPFNSITSYECFEKAWINYESNNNIEQIVPTIVFFSLTLATTATNLILHKATAEEREQFENRLKECAIKKCIESNDDSDTTKSEEVVDVHHWLRLILQEYREEQAHRRASIRLMFQTAGSTELESNFSLSTSSSNTSLDMDQFQLMVTSLCPSYPCSSLVNLYRATFFAGDNKVNYEAFLKVADEHQFFSACIQLPNLSSLRMRAKNQISENPEKEIASDFSQLKLNSKVGYIVAKHFMLYHNEIERCLIQYANLDGMGNDFAKKKEKLLLVLNKGRGNDIDGNKALQLYREILNLSLRSKMINYDASFTNLSTVTSFKELGKFSSMIEDELSSLIKIVRQNHKNTVKEDLLLSIRRKIAVSRVQHNFRERLLRNNGVPINMRRLIHQGYGSGKTKILYRKNSVSLNLLLHIVSHIIRIQAQSLRFLGPLLEQIYDYFLERFGSRWETEKSIHDFFISLRENINNHPRIMLFCQLCGISSGVEKRNFHSNEAFIFLVEVLRSQQATFSIMQPNLRKGANNDIVESKKMVQKKQLLQIVKSIFYLAFEEEEERITQDLDDLYLKLNMGSVDKDIYCDNALIFIMDQWSMYMNSRMNDLRGFCNEDTNLQQFNGFITLDSLTVIMSKVKICNTNSQNASVLRNVMLNYNGDISESIVTTLFPLISKDLQVPNARQKVDLENYRYEEKLLVSSWNSYSETIKFQVENFKKITKIDPSNGGESHVENSKHKEFDGDESPGLPLLSLQDIKKTECEIKAISTELERMNKLIDLKCSLNSKLDDSTKEDVNEVVSMNWLRFRNILSEVTRLRALAGQGKGPIPDKWDNH